MLSWLLATLRDYPCLRIVRQMYDATPRLDGLLPVRCYGTSSLLNPLAFAAFLGSTYWSLLTEAQHGLSPKQQKGSHQMESMAMAFPVKKGTIDKLHNWVCLNQPSKTGGYTANDYRALLADPTGLGGADAAVTKQVWYCHELHSGHEVVIVYWEAVDAMAARQRVLSVFTGVGNWGQSQLTPRAHPGHGNPFSGHTTSPVHIIRLLPVAQTHEIRP